MIADLYGKGNGQTMEKHCFSTLQPRWHWEYFHRGGNMGLANGLETIEQVRRILAEG